MTTGMIAALAAVVALGFVEGIRRFYPSRQTWQSLRRKRGRLAVRLMRERAEAVADRGAPRVIAETLAGLAIIWIAVASLLDKRWTEVVTDIFPYLVVGIAVVRVPGALRAVGPPSPSRQSASGSSPTSLS
jgi:hypothetical protein